jgi:hypothetical protein
MNQEKEGDYGGMENKEDGDPDLNRKQEAFTTANKQQPDLSQLSALVTAGMPLAKEYFDFQKSEFDYKVKRDTNEGSHNRKLTFSLLIFLGLVIFAMAFLTYFGKVSGDALLFLVGIVVGYLMNMIQGLLYSPWETDSED